MNPSTYTKQERELYGFTSPDKLREINLKKSRKMVSKLTDLKSAIEKFMLDAIEIGGIQTNPRPVDTKQLEQLYEKAWSGIID